MKELDSKQLEAVSGAKDIVFSVGIFELNFLDLGGGKLSTPGVTFIKPIRQFLGLKY